MNNRESVQPPRMFTPDRTRPMPEGISEVVHPITRAPVWIRTSDRAQFGRWVQQVIEQKVAARTKQRRQR